jgi:hypothetical protein
MGACVAGGSCAAGVNTPAFMHTPKPHRVPTQSVGRSTGSKTIWNVLGRVLSLPHGPATAQLRHIPIAIACHAWACCGMCQAQLS